MARGDVLLTVLAPRLTADIESHMAALMAQFGLQEEHRQRLADTEKGEPIDCVELHLSGASSELTSLRHAALELSETLGVDMVVQRNQRGGVAPRLVCFDMDSTLIKAEVIDELARRHGVGDEVAEVTERDVRFFAVQSNAAQVEAMRSGRLHIAGFSTGPTPFAVNLAGAVPFALMGSDSGQFGYTLQLFTHVDSDIHEVEDLKGKRVAHTSPTSNSGNLAPRALLPELGITPDEDYEVVYSGSHDQSMLGVVAQDYDAAPVASEVVERMAARGLYDEEDVRLIFESDRFPTTSYNYAHNLHPDLVKKIEEAFFSFDFVGTELGEEFEGVEKFIPINYQDNWKVIRTIQAANDVSYTPENLEE